MTGRRSPRDAKGLGPCHLNASTLSGPLQQQTHRGERRFTETGRLVHAGAFGGGIEVHDTHIRVRLKPGEQLSQARSPIAAAAVGLLCADVEHVPLDSADIVGAGSPSVAAAKRSTHYTVDRVLDDEASKLPRPGELVAEPTGCGDAPVSVVAPNV